MERRVEQPQEGFTQLRIVRGGPFVACWIVRFCCCTVGGDRHQWTGACDRYPPLTCIVGGVEREDMINQVWHHGESISLETYTLMLEKAAWDRQYAPTSPGANPTERIDWDKLPPDF